MKIKGLLSKNTLLLGVEKHEKKNVSSTSRHIDSTFKCSTNDGTGSRKHRGIHCDILQIVL